MKKEVRTNEVLKRESHKERKPDLGLAATPKEKLTKFEREYLSSVLMEKVAFHYEQTAKTLGLLNDHEKRTHGSNILQSDAYNDGVLAFYRCLDKFDKEPYKGKIASESTFGADKPKKLEFYFLVWAKKIVTENLLDDLKVIRGRKVYSSTDYKNEDNSEEFVPVTAEKEQNSFDLFHRILNGMGGDSVASKILATECNNDYELIWYIFTSKIEGVRSKNILREIMEKDVNFNKEILTKYDNNEPISEEEFLEYDACKGRSKAKLHSYETRTAKIFNKIRVNSDKTM